jgi:hypothetical protein
VVTGYGWDTAFFACARNNDGAFVWQFSIQVKERILNRGLDPLRGTISELLIRRTRVVKLGK